MAWSELATILRRNGFVPDALPWIALAEAGRTGDSGRQAALADIIASVADQGNSTALLRALCGEQLPEARRLALELTAQLPALDSILVPWIRPLLRDRRLPRADRLDAAAALLRTTGPRGGAAVRVLRDFAVGFGRLRLLSRRADLRRRFGNARAFDRLCARLRRTIPLRCPRCGVRRRPASMIRHLWERHGRLLTRRRVRSPMSWLDDWAARAPQSAAADDGLAHLSRQLLRRRLHSPDAEPSLGAIAARHGASLCPHCRALVTLPADEYPDADSLREQELSTGRLTGEGIVIRRVTRGIGARLEITMPSGARDVFADPQGRWNRAAAIRLLVVPWVFLAIAWSCLLPAGLALLGTAIALSAAYALRLLVRSQSAPASSGSLVNAAWTKVVPTLLNRPLTAESSRYLGRLAITSVRHGSGSSRAGPLKSAERRVGAETSTGRATAADWAALVGLRISDLDRFGDDPAPAFADALAEVLHRDEPLAHIELLLKHVCWREWTPARRERLRVALVARLFDSGLGVWELVELGEVIPAFGALLNTADLDSLARLRLLWMLSGDRPWERSGSAATVFDLAAYPTTENELAAAPDVLLYWTWNLGGRSEPVWITGRGIIFRDAKLAAPGPIEVHLRPAGRGYELHFGSARFRYIDDPSHLAHSLSEWSDYYFHEFLPQTDAALGKPDGMKLERLLRSKTLVCPECGVLFRGHRQVDVS
jgi:uncharacterized C2H2 Zn-finger protein